jgi:uncharacterized protein YbjT (DUF2867 family)
MEEKERKGAKNVLLAGGTGYLGSYIARELRKRGYSTCAIVRNPEKLKRQNVRVSETIRAELTEPGTNTDCCKNMGTTR